MRVAYTKPPSLVKWDVMNPFTNVMFSTIEFEAQSQCDMGCCVWCHRITPAFEEGK